MYKFRRFLFRISAETGLKMNYFASKYPKSPSAGRSTTRLPLRFNDYRECTKTLLPLNIFSWCRLLAILGQTETYILFSGSASSLFKNRSRATEGVIFIDDAITNSAFKNTWNSARNKMCFIMNVIIAKQKFSANLIYLSFSKFSYCQNML